MALYYVNMNAQPNGDHEVHIASCNRLPDLNNRKYLGDFTNCFDAVREAKKHFQRSNGCFYCSFECHTT